MTHRIIIAALLVAFIASEADAQNRRYRRRGALLGGLAGAAIGVAIGDKGDNETAGALIGGTVGAIAGGTIGNQKDRRIEHNQRYHSGYQHTDGRYYQGQHGYHRGQHGYSHEQPAYPAYRQPGYPQYGPAYVEPVAQPVTVEDVIQMRHRGLGEATMLRLIQTHGVAVKPTVSQVIDLHELGVSERVIAALHGDLVLEPAYTVPVPPESLPAPMPETSFGPSIIGPTNGQ
jgi:hypothetical protein